MQKWTGLAAGAWLALAVAAPVQAAQPSEQQVRQLFEVMHMGEMFSQMNTQMVGVMGQTLPCVPASYWQGFIDDAGKEELLKGMTPVYQSHFTADDVKGLLKFYQSPLGQKVLTEMPKAMAEGMKVGQQWGRKRGQAMIQQLQQEGKVDANGRCPASPAATKPAK